MSIITVNAAGTNVTYSIYRKEANRAVYIGPANTDLVKDQLIVNSASPKQSASSYGNRRSSVNYLSTLSTSNPDGTSTAKDVKCEVVVSIPAGVTFAQLK